MYMQELLTVKEVAEVMQVTTWSVLQWIYDKKLKANKPAGQWRINRGDLQLFIKGEQE